MTAGAGHTAGHTEDRTGQDTGTHGSHTTGRSGREQRERAVRQKKRYDIFKGEKEGKTPPRLAKACKCVYIHFTQYRGVWAVYCTFFYILEGYYIYLYIYIIPINVYFSFKVKVLIIYTLLYG